MKQEGFNEISERFLIWIDALSSTSDDIIPQAQKIYNNGVDDTTEGTVNQQTDMVLQDISKKIDDLLSCFDRMLESINMPMRYTNCY